jgi:hypothetical protein
VPVAVPFGVSLSADGSGQLVTVSQGGRSFGLGWPARLGTPTVAGNTARYTDVAAGTDLRLSVMPGGVEVSFVLRSRPVSPPVLRLPLSLSGLTAGVDATSTPAGLRDHVVAAA